MTGKHRLRRFAPLGAAAALALALVACAESYPNTTFTPHSEYGRAIDLLWDRLLLWGTIVFVLVEAALIFIVIKYRRRDDTIPPQTHGNTRLEILWTLIPAVILAFIAVPTVRTIFETQAKPVGDVLQVHVIGHQWWWEFKYPQYTIARGDSMTLSSGEKIARVDTLTTANELYVPTGRTVNLQLNTADVIHSFWVPQLAGKRDLISNHTNYIWFTPDRETPTTVWNGFCTEYCGSSHANMRFRVYTVTTEQFASWTQHQLQVAVFGADAPRTDTTGAGAVKTIPAVNMAASTAPALGYTFPADKMPSYTVPNTPIPAGLEMPAGLTGDAARGALLFKTAFGSWTACIACHTVKGVQGAAGMTGPNLTHVGSRNTIASALYRNDAKHLFAWIKNAPVMKPGSIMPTIGANLYDPVKKQKVTGGLTDQQIADIVAYLQALK